MFNAITDVSGLRVGHHTDLNNATGCTVILCPSAGAMAGVDVRGPAPGTRETELLRPGHLVERVHAICLAGGSAFGLDAASGVMRYLDEKKIGLDVRVARVPIVPAAIIFDLGIGSGRVRPNAEAGYRACLAARKGSVAEGNVGAGTGATVGKLLGMNRAMKGGLGTASQKIGKGIVVGALVVVNCFGDVVDPRTGDILAGTRKPPSAKGGKPFGTGMLDTASALKGTLAQTALAFMNTTLGVVATNAALTKEQVNLVAMMAHNGIARAIRPAHTMFDGDVIFALSTGRASGAVSAIGHTTAEVVAQAIVRAVKSAETLHGVPARRDITGSDAQIAHR